MLTIPFAEVVEPFAAWADIDNRYRMPIKIPAPKDHTPPRLMCECHSGPEQRVVVVNGVVIHVKMTLEHAPFF